MSSIAQTFAGGLNFFEAAPTASDTGRQLRKELAEIRCKSSERASNWSSSVESELAEIGDESGQANWDGYGAVPITTEVLRKASALSAALYTLAPSGTPAPDAVPERDGNVSLSWTRDRYCRFSVSVGEDDILSFAGILRRGVERHGTEVFDGSDPRVLEEIARYIGRLYGR